MRDAPDAQVVLEIAVARATRPDLDSGIEALAERVATLERNSGTAAGRTPVLAEASAAPAPPTCRAAPPAASGTAESHSCTDAAARTPEAAVPVPPAPATERAPAPAEVGRRPSLGAVRRRQEGPSAATGAPAGDVPPGPSRDQAPGVPATGSAGRLIDRDSLTQAWGDGVLHNLSARAKALFSAGRFVASDESGAQFALPNAAHRDRCTELASQVESALTTHFGVPGPAGPRGRRRRRG
jgi:hypothetical protein